MELMHANRQWSSRPNDERFTSLTALDAAVQSFRARSAAKIVSSRAITAQPVDGDHKGLVLVGPNGAPVAPTHWAFGQLCARAEAPAAYLRDLPAPMAADCINYGLSRRDVSDVGVLLHAPENAQREIRSITGPNYGRVWNSTITRALVDQFGDGLTGDFRVPGEFGQDVAITTENTTLYASDRDMFVFLADERHRIDVPNRRNGQSGSMARGFFVWNSEVGAQTLGIATFLFDYVCCNRIVWGAEQFAELRVRHTSSAPDRWLHEIAPAVAQYANSATASVTHALEAARRARLDNVDEFLARRFTRSQVSAIRAAHMADEDRPIETIWDAVTGATAYARGIGYQDERVKIEREAGKLLSLAA